MATIHDISKATGYSISTVSKVINNYKGISPATRKVIEATIKDMDFVPNTTAKSLVMKKSWTIAVILEDEKGTGIMHPHYSAILQSFQKTAGQNGYDTIFLNRNIGGHEISYLEHCRYRNVDGILLALSLPFDKKINVILDGNIQMISVESGFPGVQAVVSDNEMGTRQAMEHLYQLGHRKIAHIGGPQMKAGAGMERYRTYLSFLEEKQLQQKPEYYVEAAKFNEEAGMLAARRLLQQCEKDMPTAVFAACDYYALALIEVLAEKGYRVPDDLSVIGFDDINISGYYNGGITTIQQNRAYIGMLAAQLLVEKMQGLSDDVSYNEVIKIPTSLIIRKSTMAEASLRIGGSISDS